MKIKFQAEDLKASPAKEMIERFEQFGLPAYAILRPKAGAIASREAQARVTEIEEAPDPMVADGDCDVMAELEGFSVVGRTGGYVGREEFIDFIDTADAATMQRHLPEGNGPGWTDSICEGLATARAEKRPIFLEIWTTWSRNCLEMERTTLADEEVERRLADHVKIKYQADDLNLSPARELFERFYSGGLPTCVILWPKVDPVAVGD